MYLFLKFLVWEADHRDRFIPKSMFDGKEIYINRAPYMVSVILISVKYIFFLILDFAPNLLIKLKCLKCNNKRT